MSPRVLHLLAQDHVDGCRPAGLALLIAGGLVVLVLGAGNALYLFVRRGFRFPADIKKPE
jgi:hypothetical protein